MISIKEYTDTYFNDLLEFCKRESSDRSLASVNMWNKDWENSAETLLYIIKNTDRFSNDNGQFYLLFDDYRIIGCSGIYISDFSDKIGIAGVRTWLNRNYRNRQLVRNYFLVEQKLWAVKKNLDIIALTFNDYNKNLIELFKKGQRLYNREPKHMFYSNFNELDYMVEIKGTSQWIIYESLTDNTFNWNILCK